MNFLAHLVLAPQTPQGLVGSIAPDLIRGPLPADLPNELAWSAREHQSIDRITDAHRAFYRTRDALRDCVNPRLAGVLADVMFDHVLARDWAEHCPGTHAGYVAGVEQHLARQLDDLPAGMRRPVALMIEQHWLLSYATYAGLCDRLAQMSARFSSRVGRAMSLVIAEHDYERVYAGIADDFGVLWPDLQRHVEQHRRACRRRIAS